jgi:hypothetical protein
MQDRIVITRSKLLSSHNYTHDPLAYSRQIVEVSSVMSTKETKEY